MRVVHKPCVDEAAVEVIEAVVGFKRDGFFKFSQGVVDLVEHHHAVTPVRVVLCVFVIEPDGSAEIVHGLLVVPNGHEGLSSLGVVFGVG